MAQDPAANQSGVPRLDSPFVQPSLVIAIPWYRFLITLWNRTGGASGDGSGGTAAALPTGFVAWQAFDAIESGFLLCDGRPVSRVAFLALFQKLGTKWGGGDGVNTFNLPNLLNTIVVGLVPVIKT